jgi:hypothetical protein
MPRNRDDRPYGVKALATEANVDSRLVPMIVTPTTMTIERKPAMRPYSIAVAPDLVVDEASAKLHWDFLLRSAGSVLSTRSFC